MQETQVQFLGQEDPLEEGTATHSSVLAWRIPRTEEPGGLSLWGRKESETTEHTARTQHTHSTQSHILIFFRFKHQMWGDFLSSLSLVLHWHLSPNIECWTGSTIPGMWVLSISATCCCHSILPYCFGSYIKPHSKKSFLISPPCSFFLVLLLKWNIINTASRLIFKEDV